MNRDGQRSRSLILIFKITTGDLDLLGGKDHQWPESISATMSRENRSLACLVLEVSKSQNSHNFPAQEPTLVVSDCRTDERRKRKGKEGKGD